MGGNFVIEAFVTVVAGGADVLVGTAPAAAILAVIKAAITALYGQVFGVDRAAGRSLPRDPRAARGPDRLDRPQPHLRPVRGPR